MGVGIKHADDGVGENGEIGTGALAVDGVGLGVGAEKWVAAVEARCPPAEKPQMPMRSGRMPKSAAWRADVADGALGIPEFDGVMVFGSEAVFENVGADTEIVEPGGDLGAFVIHGEVGVTAAGANDDAG